MGRSRVASLDVPLFASSLEPYHDRLERGARAGRPQRALHPRPGGRGVRGGVRALPRRAPLRGRGQRHRRAHDRAARARRGPGRRGGDAVLHLLRDRRGGDRARRAAGVLRHRPRHLLRHPRHGQGGAHAAHQGDRAGGPVRQRRAGPGAARARACRWWRTRRRRRAPRSAATRAGALGDVATFSFFPSKNLPCLGDGGAIVTDDDELAERARILRFHGSKDKVTFTEVGYNSRLDELQAAVLRVLLPELDGWTERRRAVAAAYERLGLGEHARAAAADRRRRARLPPLRRALRARAAGRPRLLPHAGAPPAGGRAIGRGAARHRGGRSHELRPADGNRPHARTRSARSSKHARLGRPDQQPPRARDAAADRGDARGRARGGGHRARLRPDARAVRALRHRPHGDRPPPRRAARLQGRRAGVAQRRAGALGARAALRRGDRARLERRERGRGAAARSRRHGVRLRVRRAAAPRELPALPRGRWCRS